MVTISRAETKDAEAILALQKLAYQSEAKLYNDWSLPPLTQDVESLLEEFSTSVVLKATVADRIVGSVRARASGGTCGIGRLVVHPEFQGRGIGSKLLHAVEVYGYAIVRTQPLSPTVSVTFLAKAANAAL